MNKSFEEISLGNETNPDKDVEQEQEKNQELDVDNNENMVETAESMKIKVDAAQEELLNAQKLFETVASRQGRLAKVREKMGITNQEDQNVKADIEKAQKNLDVIKDEFRSTFADWGKTLAQESLQSGDEELTNEKLLTSLYSEKLVITQTEEGEEVSRTLAEEYESRLNETQDAVKEKTPTQKKLVSKLYEKYSKIPKWQKIAIGSTLAAGIGATTGGISVALAAGAERAANSVVKMKLSALAAGGADLLLQKHMKSKDIKNQTTDEDFAMKMEKAQQETFEGAVADSGGVEQGILEGVEKKMQIFDEMIKHQKSKQKVRVAVAALAGVGVGSGMLFDVSDAAASSGIKSGSFDFGSMRGGGDAVGTVTSSIDKISGQMPITDDNWDIDTKHTMVKGLQRDAGVIPGEDGTTLESNTGKYSNEDLPKDEAMHMDDSEIVSMRKSQTENIVTASNMRERATFSNDDWDIDTKHTMVKGLQRDAGVIPGEDGTTLESNTGKYSNEDLPKDEARKLDDSEIVSMKGMVDDQNIEQNGSHNAEFFTQFLPNEIQSLENANAASVVMKAGDVRFANTQGAQALKMVQMGIGRMPAPGENMLNYLNDYADSGENRLTFNQKKSIVNLLRGSGTV
jgi:hypothetical protein